ncbi:zinc transporter 1 [Echinops telfairi]|uniref:Zinc transporter 1 n=1 Tax=Echinops telfairi TaxID=9371 RepID=A0ABM0IHI5_ECHTE|nr:zinc transporter 1 [Echinops telfairi]
MVALMTVRAGLRVPAVQKLGLRDARGSPPAPPSPPPSRCTRPEPPTLPHDARRCTRPRPPAHAPLRQEKAPPPSVGDTEKSNNDAMEVQVNGNLIKEADHMELEEDEDNAGQLNMRGVFLHVFGDALGSVIVVVNALVFYFSWKGCPEGEFCVNPCAPDPCKAFIEVVNSTHAPLFEAGPCWVLYLDPTLCIVMVCILLYTTFPLLKESALILLQTVPKQIDIKHLIKELRSVSGVEEVHELHVWQLAGSRIIATAHIKCEDPTSYMQVAKIIKDVFHNHGIHATTIQPEFATVGSKSGVVPCELACRTQCALKQCCGTRPQALSGKDAEKAPAVSISCLELSDNLEKKPRRTKVDSIPAVVIEIKKIPDNQPESTL